MSGRHAGVIVNEIPPITKGNGLGLAEEMLDTWPVVHQSRDPPDWLLDDIRSLEDRAIDWVRVMGEGTSTVDGKSANR